MARYRRSANGSGSVTKLSGNRRKPWLARSPAIEDENGNYIQTTIGTYATRQEAVEALVQFKLAPPVDKDDFTLEQLYSEWSDIAYNNIEKSTANNYKAAWKYLTPLYKLKVKNIRSGQFRKIIEGAAAKGMSFSTLSKIKALCTMLEDYAAENDIIDKNYAAFVELPKNTTKEKPVFDDFAIQKIKKAADDGIGVADLIYVMIFTGWRIQEFVKLTVFDYDRDAQTLTGGLKTDAGRNRVVYVSDKIKPIVERYAAKNGAALFCWEFKPSPNKPVELRAYTVPRLRAEFYSTLEQLGIEYRDAAGENILTPHSTRHTFNTMLKKQGVDRSTRMKLMGQVSEATNEKYTHTDLIEMKAAVGAL